VAIAIGACDRESPLEPSCAIMLDPAALAFPSEGGTGVVKVTSSTAQCDWTAAASVPWIAVVSGAAGTGSGSVAYAVAPNSTASARTGALAVGTQVHTITQDARSACAYDVAPSSASFDAAGAQGTLAVTTTPACSWTAATSESWIGIIGGASGQGNGTVTYTVAKHTGAATRSGVIHVAGKDVPVTQSAPGCSFTVSPQTAAFGSDGGQGSVNVTAAAGCGWVANTSESWLTITGGGGGQGDGSVVYTVAKQTTADVRIGTIHVAGVDVRVVQSGDVLLCQYSVAPVTFNPCMPASTLTTTVTTGLSCPWTASASVSWLAIGTGQAGSGSGTITFSTSENYDAPRTGAIMVRWPAPTQGQNVQIAQAGCMYAVSRSAFMFGAEGGSGTFNVLQQSDPYTCGGALQDGCIWTATADVPWIVITSTGPRKGDDEVRFAVSANTTGATRSGAIRVKDKIVVITQSGA
jgi:hypothetical protein